jgi:hypothetical protein
MLESLTHEDFQPRVGEAFTVVAPEHGERSFTLAQADALPGGPDGARTPFSLVFHDLAEPYLPQQTVEMTHPEMGRFPLFVVPLGRGPDGRGFRYEAIFS